MTVGQTVQWTVVAAATLLHCSRHWTVVAAAEAASSLTIAVCNFDALRLQTICDTIYDTVCDTNCDTVCSIQFATQFTILTEDHM